MGTDLESSTAHRTEVSCLDLSRSRDRILELMNVLMAPQYFHFSFYIKKKSSGGFFAVQKLAAPLKLENIRFRSADRPDPLGHYLSHHSISVLRSDLGQTT